MTRSVQASRKFLLPFFASFACGGLLAAEEVREVPAAVVREQGEFSQESLERSIRQGVDYLLSSQNKDGSWGGPSKTKGLNIYAPIPGAHHAFRMGSSALALHGLIECGDDREAVKTAIDRAEAWFLKELPKLRRADQTTIYNCWGHAYALRALSSMARREGIDQDVRAVYKEYAKNQLDRLELYQDVDGGWGYYSNEFHTRRPSGGSMTFTTATVLLALADAEDALGVHFPAARAKQAVDSIQRNRTPDGSYIYSTSHWARPRYSINRPGGSLGRSQVCHAALRQYGDLTITDEVIERWLERLIQRNGWLDIGRKRPIPHETHFAVSGYFYFYGHYYATELMQMLPEDQWAEWQQKIAQVMMTKQDKDGSWWDYPLYNYHQAYGTGYSLVILSRCRPH